MGCTAADCPDNTPMERRSWWCIDLSPFQSMKPDPESPRPSRQEAKTSLVGVISK